jgi:hypothetical protein
LKRSYRRAAEITEAAEIPKKSKKDIIVTEFILCDLSVLCASAVKFF